MWKICMLVFLSLLRWKPLVKMKMVVDLSFGIKVWDTLFYLPGESDAAASCMEKIWRREKVTKIRGKIIIKYFKKEKEKKKRNFYFRGA